jgi:hypothetical protein
VWLVVGSLRWEDVDPAVHAMDLAALRPAVEAELRASLRAKAPARAEAVDRALLAEAGPWIAGWCWTVSDGGPVDVGGVGRGGIAEQTDAVIAAVICWRRRLEELARHFAELDARSRSLDPADKASRAASHLLSLVLEWTQLEDAWYRTFEIFLAWYMERELGAPSRARAIARETVSGRFSSWLEPGDEVRATLPADVARLTRSALDAQPIDALAAWLALRPTISWPARRSYTPSLVARDGHERYVREVDAARSGERADRMARALADARAAARAGRPLDFALLTDLQEIVLGRPAPFRTAQAFAHGGAERYGLEPDTPARFEAALADAGDAAPAIVRAARVYLDVCYFHPFEDGNARAARLALDHVLTSAGLALRAAGPVFLVARRALDQYGPGSFVIVIDHLAAPPVAGS